MNTLIAPLNVPKISTCTLLPDGCANTNYQVNFADRAPVVVRVYTRDPAAMQRECDLHGYLQDKIPMARLLHADDSRTRCPYPFAIFSYVEGILLRDILLQGNDEAIAQCSFQLGKLLARMSDIMFTEGGFFEKGLRIRSFGQANAYPNFARSLLKISTVKRDVGEEAVKALEHLFKSAGALWPSNDEAHLTHGDFDPSNIKVIERDDGFALSGILDWEFAFSGTNFCDIGQMIRYSHMLPPRFEAAFVDGLRDSNMIAATWKRSAKLMDLLRLLKLIASNPKCRRPNLNNDAVSLVLYTIKYWHTF